MSDHLSATLRIDRSAAEIFDFLRRPEHHSDVDASNVVGPTPNPGPVHRVGDVFGLEMTWRGEAGETERYLTDNVVTAYEFNRVLEWEVGPAGGAPIGWRWRYDLHPQSDWETTVTYSQDWSRASQADRDRFGLPAFSRRELEASLTLLDLALVAAHGDRPHLEDD